MEIHWMCKRCGAVRIDMAGDTIPTVVKCSWCGTIMERIK